MNQMLMAMESTNLATVEFNRMRLKHLSIGALV